MHGAILLLMIPTTVFVLFGTGTTRGIWLDLLALAGMQYLRVGEGYEGNVLI